MTSASMPVLDGYEAVELLGSGGFADVYRCREAKTRASVAIKVLKAGAHSSAVRSQIIAEAQALGRLTHAGRHPHIVAVQSVIFAEDRPCLVMEYCHGESLADALAAGRTFSVPETLRLGVQIAGALATAHSAQIVHRDVKPSNILSVDGEPKLGDFGIAALTADDVAAGSDYLTPAYAAPEVLDSGGGELADIYALAATLYEMLAGRPPFPPSDDPGVLEERIRTAPVPPITGRDVPADLQKLLRSAMTKNPLRRSLFVGSARELAEALNAIEQRLGYQPTAVTIKVYEAEGRPSPVEAPDRDGPIVAFSPPARPWEMAPKTATRRRELPPAAAVDDARRVPTGRRTSLGWVAASTVMLAVAGAGFAWLGGSRPASPPPSVPPAASGAAGEPADALPAGVLGAVPTPRVTGRRTASGAAVFTWTYAGPADGDFFTVQRTDNLTSELQRMTGPRFSVRASRDERPCVEVRVVRRGRASESGKACAS